MPCTVEDTAHLLVPTGAQAPLRPGGALLGGLVREAGACGARNLTAEVQDGTAEFEPWGQQAVMVKRLTMSARKPRMKTMPAIAATEAARDAIEVTRKSSQAELRAYIHLENIEITGLEPARQKSRELP